jgi:RND family efflux transporter MFP subunit
MMKSHNSRLYFASITIIVLAGLSSCTSQKQPASSAAPELVRDVVVLQAASAAGPEEFAAMGTVRPSETAQLSSQIMGTVVAVDVREGDRVHRGQLLATIDDAQTSAGLDRATAGLSAATHEAAAAEADYALASATLKRYQDLFEKKSVSPQEFDEINARFQAASAHREMARSGETQAKAALALAQTMSGYTRILAPFDGVVSEKRVDPGTLASPGVPLLVVETTNGYRLETTVDESDIQYVRRGSDVPVQIDSFGPAQLRGKVVQVMPGADPASRSFIVKIELPPNSSMRSGLFGRAYFTGGEHQSISVPRTAIVDRGQLHGVYVLNQEKIADLRYVTLGGSKGAQVEVLSGLQGGETFVAAPNARDLAGKRLEVR